MRTLYDCADVAVGSDGLHYRVVVATHPANAQKSRVGLTRAGVVYELFLTNLPQDAFTAADVLSLYLHRGAFEPTLADEDQGQDPDRWCSHAPCGQQAWQILSPWVWNLRLELGHQLEPSPLRITAFAPARLPANEEAAHAPAAASGYGPPERALPRISGPLRLRRTLLSKRMARCAVRLERACFRRPGAGKLLGACVSSLRLVSECVAAVGCVSSVNGMARPPSTRAG